MESRKLFYSAVVAQPFLQRMLYPSEWKIDENSWCCLISGWWSAWKSALVFRKAFRIFGHPKAMAFIRGGGYEVGAYLTRFYLILRFWSALLFKVFKTLCSKNSAKSLFCALLFKTRLYLRRASNKGFTVLHKPYLVKWSTKGGGGQKCSPLIYLFKKWQQ